MEYDQKEMLYPKGQFEKNADLYPVIPQCEIDWLNEEMSDKVFP